MSDDFRNINDIDREPEDQAAENKKEETYTQGESFVMRSSQETTASPAGQNSQEPQEAPTEENPYYARTYKKVSEPEKEKTEEDGKKDQTEEQKEKGYTSYQFASAVPPEKQTKKKKSPGTARKLGFAAACAAVFGLVAGVVFQGVNYVGGQLLPEETTTIAQAQLTNNNAGSSSDTSSSSQGSVAQVAANTMSSIVAITSVSMQEIPSYYGYWFGGGNQEQETESSGSGIIVGQNDTELLIATNNHVVEGADSLTVCFTNQDGTAASTASDVSNTSTDSEENSTDLEGGTAVAAQIKGTDVDNDLAVVSVKLSDIPEDVRSQITVANLGSSDELAVGEQVVAIGNALGYGQSVTSGYVSALNKQVSSEDVNGTFIQTDAAINPGNSGGALLNMNGEVVGINSSKIASSSVEGMGFAIPISRAEPILDDLMSKETREKVEDESQAAYLGITCLNVSSNTEEMYNMPVGVFVRSVEENGSAAEAGIQEGDIIQKFDGTTVQTYDNLTNQLSYYRAGEQVEIVIARAEGGAYQEQTVTVTLGARSDAQSSTQSSQSGE